MRQIKNDRGLVIGFSTTQGSVIKYFHLRKGHVGYYNTSSRRYTRLLTSLGPTFPIGETDFGMSDVLAADRL